MLSNEQVFCAAAVAAVCGMRYWTLRNEELNKAKDVGTPFVPTKALSLKDMIVIGKKYSERRISCLQHTVYKIMLILIILLELL